MSDTASDSTTDTMSEHTGGGVPWRREMPRKDRHRVYLYVKKQLAKVYPDVSDEVLQDRAHRVEAFAYRVADSRLEYLEKVADELGRRKVHATQEGDAGSSQRSAA